MDKRKRKKIVVITACIVVLLGVFLGVEYNKYREKPLLQVIPISQDEIADIRLSYNHGGDFKLDTQQIAELWDILADCRVKFWSADRIFPNFYARAFLSGDYLSSVMRDVDLSFSSDGRIRVQALRNGGRATSYKFIEGEEAVYQFLDKMQWQE